MSSLSIILAKKNKNPLMDTDNSWRQFVLDHRFNLIAGATPVLPTNELLAQNNYDLQRYLRAINIDPTYHWIVYILNDIDSDMMFHMNRVKSVIYIPTQADVTRLYTTYKTVSQENSA